MKDKLPFAGYVKESEVTLIKITHRVRLRVGSSARDIAAALIHVPPGCTLNEVVGDQEHDDFELCGEMVFTEDVER